MQSSLLLLVFIFISEARIRVIPSECDDQRIEFPDDDECDPETQIRCSKGYDSQGCPLGHFCYDFDPKDACDVHCPCVDELEISCQSSADVNPLTGCPPKPTCIPATVKSPKGIECLNHCPAKCPPGLFRKCRGIPDQDGCVQADTCVQPGTPCPVPEFDTNGCKIFDPKSCEEYCPPTYDSEGCKEEYVCKVDVEEECPGSEFDASGCKVIEAEKCEKDQILCSQGEDEKGCLIGFTCEPKKKDDCPNYCPVHCSENQMACPREASLDECPVQEVCIPKSLTRYTRNGKKKITCENHCRAICDRKTERTCRGTFDENGCQGPETCVSKEEDCPQSTYDHNGCPYPQSLKCKGDEEILCPGGRDEKGCKMDDVCLPRTVDDCPQHCPVHCAEDEVQCPGGEDENGCKLPDSCVPKKAPSTIIGDYCDGICPQRCNSSEIKCVTVERTSVKIGFFAQTKHCVIEETCIEAKDPETNCTNYCPKTCAENEQKCQGPVTPNGCPLPDVCIPSVTVGGRENECPEYCPVQCSEGQKMCRGTVGSDSCRGPPICVGKDEDCPEEVNDRRGCQLFKKPECAEEDEIVCSGTYGADGCPGAPICVTYGEPCPLSEFDEKGCSLHPPLQCDWSSEKICPGGLDEDIQFSTMNLKNKGCEKPGECVPAIVDGCINFCPVICDEEMEQVCPGGTDSKSCKLEDFCSPKNRPCPRKNPKNSRVFAAAAPLPPVATPTITVASPSVPIVQPKILPVRRHQILHFMPRYVTRPFGNFYSYIRK